MAFDALDSFVEDLAQQYITNKNGRNDIRIEVIILETMCNYYERLKEIPKFRGQREHCKSRIYELSPAYAKGYFETKTRKS